MPGLIVAGKVELVPGLEVRSWFDDNRLRLESEIDARV
jgi:hypothetical protein